MSTNNSQLGFYSLIVGLVYLVVGCGQIINGFIGFETLILPGDFFQGAMLAIIGLVFGWGFSAQRKGDNEWDAYLSVGTLLAGIIFALYIFMLLSNGLGWVLGFEDWLEWSPIEQFQPGLWLFSVAIPGAYFVLKEHVI
jgi:hypothetical protein